MIAAAPAVLVFAAVGGAGCRPAPMEPVGISSRIRETASAHPPLAPPGRASPVPADFRTTWARVVERAVSSGHAERFEGIVWANDAARGAWDTTAPMPDGAMLIEEAIERGPKGDRAAGLYAMRKAGGAWEFVVVDPAGRVVEGANEAACAACHREAPGDGVFRPGRRPDAASGNAP